MQGKIIPKDIRQTAPLRNEKAEYYLSNYLIGIALAGCYLLLTSFVKDISESAWTAFVFGLFTIVFPWFWLLPSTGFGFMADKSAKRKQILKTNLINHTNFGIGLYVWMMLFHNIFVKL